MLAAQGLLGGRPVHTLGGGPEGEGVVAFDVQPAPSFEGQPQRGGCRGAISNGPAGSGPLIHVKCGPDPGVAGHCIM